VAGLPRRCISGETAPQWPAVLRSVRLAYTCTRALGYAGRRFSAFSIDLPNKKEVTIHGLQ
jgi:hypothetical protein